jgi:hypothetical protein
MPSLRVSALTREDITAAAKKLRSTRPAKWTVVVEGRELAARPLILAAAGVPPNDPTNSHQAVKILKDQGFDIRYQGEPVPDEKDNENEDDIEAIDQLLAQLRGSCKGKDSLVEARDREHRLEK